MLDGTSEYPREEQPRSPDAISPEEIREQLRRILSSATFRNAPRHRLFLDFVVKQALSEKKENLREATIGRRVFDHPDFDPKSDSTVRAEARRLRARLAEYYSEVGRHDPIHIDLPKGYAPVFSRNGVTPLAEQPAPETILPASDTPPRVAEAAVRPRERAWRRWMVAAAVVLVAVVATAYRISHRRAKFGPRDSVVLADFVNHTGDPVFDDSLKTALRVALNQSPFLSVLSDEKVTTTLQLMAKPASAALTPEVTRELCQRANGKAYIAGSITSVSTSYVLELKAVNCLNGDLLAQEEITASSKGKIVGSLGQAAAKLRGQLGESLATVQKFNVPLVQATTPSLEALKAHSLGLKASNEKGADAGLSYDLYAIQLDPKFALGYWSVGLDYYSRGELGRASEYLTKAFTMREHASTREALMISADYYSNVTGQLDKAVETYHELIKSYPSDPAFPNSLGTVLATQGLYKEAVEAMRQSQQVAPDAVIPYENLGNYLLALQRLEEARQTINQAQARQLDDVILHNALYALAFLGGNLQAMAEQQRWYKNHPSYEDFGFSLASDTAAYAGHLREARELTGRASDFAVHNDSKENGALWQENAALREAAFGNRTEARQLAAAGLKLAPGSQGVGAEAALALAMAGDAASAESQAADLNRRYPVDTQMQALWLPAVEAQIALNRNQPEVALERLQRAAPPVEYGLINFLLNISCLYPTYLRGQAELSAGQGRPAALEFQRILDHRGIVWNCWTGALATLGLARANVLQANESQGADADAARARAFVAYKQFLLLWKDADPDIPIYKEAKAEYAKLSRQ